MDKVLSPNPDGCKEFARHQFKKDRCKNCGKSWKEHLGAISDELVTEFLFAQKEVEDRRRKQEEEAKELLAAKARAKKQAKKKTRAVEDDWFFSGGESGGTASEEEGVGFQMLQGGDLQKPAAPSKPRPVERAFQPKVVNLIDFTECDLPDEPAIGSTAMPVATTFAPDLDDGIPAISSTAMPSATTMPLATTMPSATTMPLATPAVMLVPPAGPGDLTVVEEEIVRGQAEEELLAEIEHLRQRLKDADAERSVQVSIVRDEVDEKQKIIEELENKRLATEKMLTDALTQVEALRKERDAAAQAAKAAAEAAAALEAAKAAAEAEAAEKEAAALVAARGLQQEADPELEALQPQRLQDPVEAAGMEAVKPPGADPELNLRPRNGLLWKLMQQQYWLKCLRPSDLSDPEQ